MRFIRGITLTAFTAVALGGFIASASAATSTDLKDATAFFSTLAHETNNPVIATFAEENLHRLSTPAAAARQQIVVPLLSDTSASSILVPLVLNRANMGTFVVDTGATYTVITPEFARRAGVRVSTASLRMTIMTANGPILAPVVVVPSMTLGTVEIRNVRAVVQELGKDNRICGLLGMNFFRDIDLTIQHDKLILGINSPSSPL